MRKKLLKLTELVMHSVAAFTVVTGLAFGVQMYPGACQTASAEVKVQVAAKLVDEVAVPELTSRYSNGKKMYVNWNKVYNASGYELRYSTSSNMTGAKNVTISSGNKKTVTVTNVKKNATYYISLRAYRTKDGKKIYSAWNSKKKIKIASGIQVKDKKKLKAVDKTSVKMAKNIVKKIINPAMSDFEKTKIIHDWLIMNLDYDQETLKNGYVSDYAYTPYKVFKSHKAVCDGYAKSFEVMANLSGLSTVYVTGYAWNGQAHAWNQVKVSGKWYNIDVTWDDPTSAEKKASDHVSNNYNYFLQSDKDFYRSIRTKISAHKKCTAPSLYLKAYQMGTPWGEYYASNEQDIHDIVAYMMSLTADVLEKAQN